MGLKKTVSQIALFLREVLLALHLNPAGMYTPYSMSETAYWTHS
jgi:hypothetical protein